MRRLSLQSLIFPITLVAFEAVGVRYWQIIFTDATRWLFLSILFVVILLRGDQLRVFRTGPGIVLAVYMLWCLCTSLWSEAPKLTLMKSVALIVTLPTLFGAGYYWTSHPERNSPFAFLLPILVLGLFAGWFDRGAAISGGTIQTYQGLAGNPNYLGSIVAMGFPFAIWQAYANPRRRLLFIGIIVALSGSLWFAASRAALLVVLMMALGFLMTLESQRRMLAFGSIVLLTCMAVAVPAIQTSLYERFIIKGNVETGDALYTRREVWSESYELAKQGGFVGAGYGVSTGSGDFSGGLTVVGYGREKGNSQLAVWEEAGIVGLALYAMIVAGILIGLGSSVIKMARSPSKTELGLLFGAVVGFTVHSIFEAWWGAPGSPEFAFFWSMVGAAYGVAHRARLRGPRRLVGVNATFAPARRNPIAAAQ